MVATDVLSIDETADDESWTQRSWIHLDHLWRKVIWSASDCIGAICGKLGTAHVLSSQTPAPGCFFA